MHRGFATVPGIQKVGVVGLGLMGHGVAQMAAAAGYDVVGIEMEQKSLDVGMQRINDSLQLVAKRNVKKGMDEGAAAAQVTETLGRISARLAGFCYRFHCTSEIGNSKHLTCRTA